MLSKISVSLLGIALIALAACGNSNHPARAKPAAEPDVAETAPVAAPPQVSSSSPAVAAQPIAGEVNPNQIPNVGTAPAGQIAFGPSAPNTGMDPAGDAELAHMREVRAKQRAAMNRQQQTPAVTVKTVPSTSKTGN